MMLMSNTSNVPFAALHSALHSWASASRKLLTASAFLHPAAQSREPEHSDTGLVPASAFIKVADRPDAVRSGKPVCTVLIKNYKGKN
jgi:hypothetical protein